MSRTGVMFWYVVASALTPDSRPLTLTFDLPMTCIVRHLPGVRVVAQTHSAGTIASHVVAQPLLAVVVAGRCSTDIDRRRLDATRGRAWAEPALERRAN